MTDITQRPATPAPGQAWILDQLLRISPSEDVLHPGISGIRLERGFKFGDMQRVLDRVNGSRSFPRAWEAEAVRQVRLAELAESREHIQTAAQHRHRAALYFGRAQHLTPATDMTRKRARHAALRDNYDHLIEHLDGAVSYHRVDGPDGLLATYLYFRAPGDGPKPTVLYIPGMDATKEDYPNPFLNDFVSRGMNVISMDGPGQGEVRIAGVTLTLNNYSEAVSAVIDDLSNHDGIDLDHIACFGTSMGTYWSVLATRQDARIKALAGQMPNVGTKEVIFNEAQPNFRRIFKYMVGISSDSEFNRLIPKMDGLLEEAGDNLRVPYLLVGGDQDELTPVEHIDAWFDRLTCPKELWLYNGVFHPMGEVVADAYPALADWIRHALSSGLPQGHAVRIESDPTNYSATQPELAHLTGRP